MLVSMILRVGWFDGVLLKTFQHLFLWAFAVALDPQQIPEKKMPSIEKSLTFTGSKLGFWCSRLGPVEVPSNNPTLKLRRSTCWLKYSCVPNINHHVKDSFVFKSTAKEGWLP